MDAGKPERAFGLIKPSRKLEKLKSQDFPKRFWNHSISIGKHTQMTKWNIGIQGVASGRHGCLGSRNVHLGLQNKAKTAKMKSQEFLTF